MINTLRVSIGTLLQHTQLWSILHFWCIFGLFLLRFYSNKGCCTIKIFKIHTNCQHMGHSTIPHSFFLKKKNKIIIIICFKKYKPIKSRFSISCIHSQTKGIRQCLTHFLKKISHHFSKINLFLKKKKKIIMHEFLN